MEDDMNPEKVQILEMSFNILEKMIEQCLDKYDEDETRKNFKECEACW